MRRALAFLPAVLATALAGCGGGDADGLTAEEQATERITNIYETCIEAVQHPDALALGDDGQTLTVDGFQSYEDEAAWCVIDELDNDALRARIDRTRPIDGVQSDKVEGVDVEWSAQVGEYDARWIEMLVTVAD